MKPTTLNNTIFLVVTVLVLLVSILLIGTFSGFEHEMKTFKTMLVSTVLILLFQFLVCDPIKFIVLSIDTATWPQTYKVQMEKDSGQFNHIDYLKFRLNSLRSQLKVTKEHRNEQLNEKYYLIANDLFLYGSYFLVLTLFVLAHQNVIMYYNTNSVKKLFSGNTSSTIGLLTLLYVNQIYDFIEFTMIEPFDPNVEKYHHDSWTQIEQMKMLGVARLRQVRAVDPHIGLGYTEWEINQFLPEWQLPYQRLHYTTKYWRTYEPWEPLIHNPTLLNGLLLNFDHIGGYQSYPELNGYISLLTPLKSDSMKVLEFLKTYNWIDSKKTAAVFIDFTLYNADANIFSVCTMTIENTAFGLQVPTVNVESSALVENLSQHSHFEIIVLFIYFLLLIRFVRTLIVKIWYDPKEIRKPWNQVDLIICFLNISVLLLTVLRDAEVAQQLKVLETASKAEFLNFRRPIRLYLLTKVVVGFLICVTTFRLWKVFQFASVFQVFTTTLYVAWPAVVSTGLIIVILFIAVGICAEMINGDHSQHFYHITKSTVSCMCFAMGFISHMNSPDKFFGGSVLGVIFYLILVIIVTIVLINVFASIIYVYFSDVEQKKKDYQKRHINFLQFLRVEYGHLFKFLRKWFWISKAYRSNGRTVTQNIDKELDDLEKYADPSKSIAIAEKREDFEIDMEYKRCLERSYCLVSIMRVQVELLERMLFGDKDGNLETLSESDYTSDSDIPEMYRKKATYKY